MPYRCCSPFYLFFMIIFFVVGILSCCVSLLTTFSKSTIELIIGCISSIIFFLFSLFFDDYFMQSTVAQHAYNIIFYAMCIAFFIRTGMSASERKGNQNDRIDTEKKIREKYLNENCFSIRLNIKMQLTFNHSTLFRSFKFFFLVCGKTLSKEGMNGRYIAFSCMCW